MAQQAPAPADMTPVEIDTKLYDLYLKELKAEQSVQFARADIHNAAGDKSRYIGNRRSWTMTFDEAVKAVEKRAATDATYIGRDAQRSIERLNDAVREVERVRKEGGTYDAEFIRRGGWTRAFLAVTNGKGHVHSSMNCSTCNKGEQRTQFSWMVDYSGHTEEEIVEAAAERACTVCYPSAPVEVLERPTKMFTEDEVAAQKAREEREAKKAAAAAKKAAKAITDTDGGPLRVFSWRTPERKRETRQGLVTEPARDNFDTLATLHAARGWLTDQFEGWRGNSGDHRDLDKVADAVALKEGKTREQAIQEAKQRAARRK
jgi:hypothetical protein